MNLTESGEWRQGDFADLVGVILIEHSVQTLSSLAVARVGSALRQSQELHLQATKLCDCNSAHLTAHRLASLPALIDEDNICRDCCMTESFSLSMPMRV